MEGSKWRYAIRLHCLDKKKKTRENTCLANKEKMVRVSSEYVTFCTYLNWLGNILHRQVNTMGSLIFPLVVGSAIYSIKQNERWRKLI